MHGSFESIPQRAMSPTSKHQSVQRLIVEEYRCLVEEIGLSLRVESNDPCLRAEAMPREKPRGELARVSITRNIYDAIWEGHQASD